MTAPDAVRVGFVGLGNMGWPMAHNLSVAGFSLIVHDADPARSSRFAAEHRCEKAATAGDFAGAGVVVTMLPDDRAVADVVLRWDGGIAAALAAGAVVVDMSSSNPVATRALGDELSERELELIDAPVSGGITRATDGTLAIMVGTDSEAAFERARPVLEVLGGRLFRTGPRGSGHAMKALNNFLGASAYASLAEALADWRVFWSRPKRNARRHQQLDRPQLQQRDRLPAGRRDGALWHRVRTRVAGQGRRDRGRARGRSRRRCAGVPPGRRNAGPPPPLGWAPPQITPRRTSSGNHSPCRVPRSPRRGGSRSCPGRSRTA